MPFRALGLDANIFKAIQEAGYTEPTPIQAAAIPQVLAGHDLIGIAQTGTGKTAAFTLPMLAKLSGMLNDGLARKTRTLILAPTRELVVQIEENVRAYAKHLPSADGDDLRRRGRASADRCAALRRGHRDRVPRDGCSI